MEINCTPDWQNSQIAEIPKPQVARDARVTRLEMHDSMIGMTYLK